MSNYKKGREINHEGEEGEKVKKYIFFFLFPPSFCALFAFAVKNSFLVWGFSTRSLNDVRIRGACCTSQVWESSLILAWRIYETGKKKRS
jgi:hypothetical protein